MKRKREHQKEVIAKRLKQNPKVGGNFDKAFINFGNLDADGEVIVPPILSLMAQPPGGAGKKAGAPLKATMSKVSVETKEPEPAAK